MKILFFLLFYAALAALLFIKFRTKILKPVFICFFFLTMLLPLVFIDTKSESSALENRILAEWPKLLKNNAPNFDAPKEIDNYINDRFGFRNYFVTLYNLINYNILGKKQNSKVLVGKEGWLYYIIKEGGHNLEDFTKKNLFDDDTLRRFIGQIEKRAEWCEDNGIPFIFLISPNKHNVYPEYYPFSRPEGLTRTDQIINSLPPNLRNKTIFPRDYLIAKKGTDVSVPLYYETDTHWNEQGAFYAYEVLREKIRSYFPDVKFPLLNNYSRTIEYDFEGDLVLLFGRGSGSYQRTLVKIEPEGGWQSLYTYIKNEYFTESKIIITQNVNQELPKAIIFGDSFFGVLEPFTSTLFSRAEYLRKYFEKSDTAYILENRPDIIIFEIVERSVITVPLLTWD
jgi:hypothetical protein